MSFAQGHSGAKRTGTNEKQSTLVHTLRRTKSACHLHRGLSAEDKLNIESAHFI